MASSARYLCVVAALAATLAVASAGAARTATVVRTAQGTGDRLTPQPSIQLSDGTPPAGVSTLAVDGTKTYQAMLGFGGAFTDSATHVLGQLNKTTYDRVMDSACRARRHAPPCSSSCPLAVSPDDNRLSVAGGRASDVRVVSLDAARPVASAAHASCAAAAMLPVC